MQYCDGNNAITRKYDCDNVLVISYYRHHAIVFAIAHRIRLQRNTLEIISHILHDNSVILVITDRKGIVDYAIMRWRVRAIVVIRYNSEDDNAMAGGIVR